MTAIIRNYSAVVVEGPDGKTDYGSLQEPIGESTVNGTYVIPGRLTVQAGSYQTIWEQEYSNLKFEQVAFRIVGEGTLMVAARSDLPTALGTPGDYTTLGTRKRWAHHWYWPCSLGDFKLCDQLAPSHATLANMVADNNGVPSLWTTYSASKDIVIFDKVMVMNPGTAVVTVERLIVK